jgi:hypothetical protein
MSRLIYSWMIGLSLLSGPTLGQNISNGVPVPSIAVPPDIINLWPRIPFVRAKDLCQYQDAFGQSKIEHMRALTQNVRSLLREGVDSSNLVDLLNVMDQQNTQLRTLADNSPGMDVLLSASLKAAVDKIYSERRPQKRRLNFLNPASMNELLKQIDNSQKMPLWDIQVIRSLNGVAYGTYSYAPSCKGDLVVTLHIDLSCGVTYNFQAKGLPDELMASMGHQIFDTFQKTQFPSKIKIGKRTVELIGAPNGSLGVAPSPKSAEMACKALKARLPSADEYEYLSNLGDWNGGVACTRGKLWAMDGGMVMAPDLPNPSPVRSVSEFPGQNFSYYCVR